MTGLTDLEIQEKLLMEAEQALKTELSKIKNVVDAFDAQKSKVITNMGKGFWDEAQNALLQAKVLSVRVETAKADVKSAEGRVAGLKAAIEREKIRLSQKPIYVPYQPEPKIPYQPEPKPEPAPENTEAAKAPVNPENPKP
jgi:hypothetical protein